MFLWLIIIFFGLIFVYLYLRYDKSFKIYNVETGKRATVCPLLEFAGSIIRSDTSFFISQEKQIRKYGKVHQIWFIEASAIVTDIEIVKLILAEPTIFRKMETPANKWGRMAKFLGQHNLVSVNDDEWKVQRRLFNTMFMKNDIFFDDMVSKITQCLDLWKSNGPINIQTNLQKMTLDVLGICIFGKDFNTLGGETVGPLNSYNYLVHHLIDVLPLLFPLIGKLPLQKYKKFDLELENFNKYIFDLLKEARNSKSKSRGKTLLHLLVEEEEKEKDFISEEAIRGNIVLFFLAGHETTAVALVWAVYLLAKYPQIQEKAREEVDLYFRTTGGKCDYETHKTSLEYISYVIKETLRLYPPGAGLAGRRVQKDVVSGGYLFPKGSLVAANIWSIHHSPEYYSDPENFDPDRWNPERKQSIPKGAYLPFSGGPRVCIGQSFSLLEQKIFLTLLLKKYKFELASNLEIKIQKFSIALAPQEKTPVQVVFHQRD